MASSVAYELLRFRTRDGDETTVYLVRHPLATTHVSVLHFPEPRRLDHWCAATGHPEAIVAGFFVRDLDVGELARLMISFGAREAINLDGGGSATLVHRGHLLNRPYSNYDRRRPSRARSSPRSCSTLPEHA